MHGVCAQLLLLLVDYLRILHRTKLADTACFMLGGALAQQEHMLRSTRVEHWPWEAVQHMDALVQLYAQLLQQVRPVHGGAGGVIVGGHMPRAAVPSVKGIQFEAMAASGHRQSHKLGNKVVVSCSGGH